MWRNCRCPRGGCHCRCPRGGVTVGVTVGVHVGVHVGVTVGVHVGGGNGDVVDDHGTFLVGVGDIHGCADVTGGGGGGAMAVVVVTLSVGPLALGHIAKTTAARTPTIPVAANSTAGWRYQRQFPSRVSSRVAAPSNETAAFGASLANAPVTLVPLAGGGTNAAIRVPSPERPDHFPELTAGCVKVRLGRAAWRAGFARISGGRPKDPVVVAALGRFGGSFRVLRGGVGGGVRGWL